MKQAVRDALAQALKMAQAPEVPHGPNPRVGAVVLDAQDHVVGEGFHRGAGTDHAEVVALKQAGDRANGGTIIVTLEPCNHVGRTGACSEAIIAAGISSVVFAMSDPNPVASGGASRLAQAGIEVQGDVAVDEATAINHEWVVATRRGRPWVTWKIAMSKDGFVTAPSGGWFTSDESKVDVHILRSTNQAVVVGTQTVFDDNPSLTVRMVPSATQPLRVVVGHRDVPDGMRIVDDSASYVHIKSHDAVSVLAQLWGRGINRVLLESGPTVGRAWLAAGAVDEVVIYIAPQVFGEGPSALADGDLVDFSLIDTRQIGADVRLTLRQGQR